MTASAGHWLLLPAIWFVLFFVLAEADIAQLAQKASEVEAALEAKIAKACASESNSSDYCTDLYQRRSAVQKVKQAEISGLQGAAGWTEFVEALQRLPRTLDDDVESWLPEQMDSVLSVDDLKIMLTLQNGSMDPDDYFWGDVKEHVSARRLGGPDLAGGRPWPDRTLVYAWHPKISSFARRALESGMKEIRSKTCLKFQEVEWGFQGPHVQMIDSEDGCWSYVGWRPPPRWGQKLNLAFFCRFHAVAVHELLHALGHLHESERPDRDFFVDVVMENVQSGKEHNFEKDDRGYTGRPYDMKSVMHYGRFSFSKGLTKVFGYALPSWTLTQLAKWGADNFGNPTLKARNPYFTNDFGNNVGLTDNDVEQLQDMYQCSKLPMSSSGSPGWGVRWSNGPVVGNGEEAVAVECNAGYAMTSCSCFHERGDCRGATLTEVNGRTCVAAGQKGSGSGVKAHAICLKLETPHYAVARLSASESKTASQACSSSYTLVGCSCISLDSHACKASPDFSAAEPLCKVKSGGSVRAQAICLRSPGMGRVQLVQGEAGAESIAQCPESTELTSCSCTGESDCKGARPVGDNSNKCKAYAKEWDGGKVVATAICASLLPLDSSEPSVSAAAGYLTKGSLRRGSEISTWAMPIQSAYCDSMGGLSPLTGESRCSNITVQTREEAQYGCGRQQRQECRIANGVATCYNVTLAWACNLVSLRTSVPLVNLTKVTVSQDSMARCPAGFFVASMQCLEDCKTYELTCAPPPKDAAWFLSGSRSASSWFNGGAIGLQSAMGTCGHAVAVGLECASSTMLKDTSCFYIRLICRIQRESIWRYPSSRRVAISGADRTERRSSFDLSFAEPAWSNWVSDTGIKEKVVEWQFSEKHKKEIENPDYKPAQKLQCSGDYCDNLRLEMAAKFGTWGSYKQLKGTPTVWTAGFGEYEMICPAGHYVASLKCTKSYCYQKELLCAEPASDKWHVASGRYYSHCFTNAATMDWMNWLRDRAHSIRGRTRTCTGVQPSQMPNMQSCGEDGVIVGLRCFGSECDRMQLVCSSLETNINSSTGEFMSVSDSIAELKQLGLYEDTSSWEHPPKDGLPSSWKWDGQQLLKADAAAFMVSVSRRLSAGCLHAVLIAMLASAAGSGHA